MIKKSKVTRWLIFMVFISLAGCSQSSEPTAAMQASINNQRTKTPTKSALATNTPFLTPTNAITNTPTPTLVSISTLSVEAAQKELVRLMQSNNDCNGNCFWGIKPGITDFNHALQFLHSIDNNVFRETEESFNNTYVYKNHQIFVSLEFYAKDGEIQNLHTTVNGLHFPDVTGSDWSAFRVDNFLKANGVPKDVHVVMLRSMGNRLSYLITFFYDQMYAKYSGNQNMVLPNHIMHACPVLDQNVKRFDLWLGEYDKNNPLFGENFTMMTSLTPQELYDIITGEPDEACFDLDFYKFYPPNE